MGGVRRKKSRRTVNSTIYRKKRKNKSKLPPKVTKDIKEQWDYRKSLKQNLQSLNLIYSPDEVLSVEAESVTMEEELIPNPTHKIPKSTSKEKTVHITPNKAQFMRSMINDHQDDYEKMSRDKRNIYQLSAGQLRKQCLQFLKSKQFMQMKETPKGLQEDDLNHDFFSKVVDSKGTLVKWKPMEVNTGGPNLTEVKNQIVTRKIGLFGYKIYYTSHTGVEVEWPVVMKSKPLDSDIAALMTSEQASEAEVAQMQAMITVSSLRLSQLREGALFQLEKLQQFLPQVYHTISSIDEEKFVVIMEHLSEENVTHLNVGDDISKWTTADIKILLRDMAKIHALFMDKVEWLRQQPWMDNAHSRDVAINFYSLWKGVLPNSGKEIPEFWTKEVLEMTEEAIDSLDEIWKIYESFPNTLSHNDFTPRNLCIRKATSDQGGSSDEDPRRLCIYDWEMARIDVPQHDLAECLAFVLPPDCSMQRRMELIGYYIEMLEKYSKHKFDRENFLKVLDAAALEYLFNRLNLQSQFYKAYQFTFVPRVVGSNAAYLLQRKSDGHVNFIKKK